LVFPTAASVLWKVGKLPVAVGNEVDVFTRKSANQVGLYKEHSSSAMYGLIRHILSVPTEI